VEACGLTEEAIIVTPIIHRVALVTFQNSQNKLITTV